MDANIFNSFSNEDKIAKVRMDFLYSFPFLGVLSFYLKIKENKNLPRPTMGTDGDYLYYHPDFLKKTTYEELQSIIAHEIMHCVYQHCSTWRKNGNKNMIIWNMACDYIVNEAVVEMFKLSLPKNVLIDKKFYNMLTEEVYDILNKMSLSREKHCLWDNHIEETKRGHGEKESGEEKESGNRDENIWKIRVFQAIEAQKSKGDLPLGLERLVGNLLSPKISWQTVLSEFLTTLSNDDFSWRKPNRRYIHTNVILPSIYNKTINIAIVIDTSGSINDDMLNTFFSEIKGIMSCFPSYNIHLLSCDAAVHNYQMITQREPEIDIKGLAKGGGGTNFRPAFDELEKREIVPDALIYFTDLMGTFPKSEPQYPVLWITLHTYETVAPFGRVIKFDGKII